MSSLLLDATVGILFCLGTYAVVREYRAKVSFQRSLDQSHVDGFLIQKVVASSWDDSSATFELELSRANQPSRFVVKVATPPHWVDQLRPGVLIYGRWLPEHDHFVPDWNATTEAHRSDARGYRG